MQTPLIATDIIIEYNDGKKQGIVLIERRDFPYGIAIPGGMAEVGLTLEQNAVKESKEETGLEVVIENPEQPLCVHSDPNRDPRAHVVSVTYIGRGQGVLKAGDDAKIARLYSIDEVVNMLGKEMFAFDDHENIIRKFLVYRGYLK
jgi:ADP-ribose pyrophosphatase YjhB (NUDIX family)